MSTNTPPMNPATVEVSDLDSAGEVLAKETAYCEICGAPLAMWPPELVTEHAAEKHADTMWPAIFKQWEIYKAQPDSIEKIVSTKQGRAQFLVRVLTTRFDIYQKLVDAAVIRKPRKG